MSGCWVTWPAVITIRSDILDIEPYLKQGVSALREHRDVVDAFYEFQPPSGTVSFVLRVRYGITEVIAKRQAADALHENLPWAGFASSRWRRVGPTPVAWLRFAWWPTDFRWW